ncbi:MAG: PAS domain-containing protein [Legionellaceae bacterium]|nr:PAS domain-containing protein [Legionellaceae bacterium]
MLEPKIPDNEQERLQDLYDLEILDTADEASFNRITLIAKEFFDVDIVAISLVDAERQWFKSIQGLDVKQTPRNISFCGHTILEHDLFIIGDAIKDQRFSDNPLVTGEPKIRFYAGAQLVSPRGNNVGTLCIIDKKPKKLNAKQKQFLKDLASWVEIKLNFKRFGMVFNELKNSQVRLDLATQSAQIGVWEWNIKTNALIWDDRMYKLYGIKKEDFSGAYDAWAKGVHPDDREEAVNNLQQAQRTKQRFNTEFRVVWPDKSVRYIRAFGQVNCDETGASISVIGVNWDITLQKEQEIKIQHLMHSDDLTGLLTLRTALCQISKIH